MTVNVNTCEGNFFYSEKRQSKATRRPFLVMCGFEEEACWLLGRLASGPDDICNIFADFIQRTYADDVWVPSDPGPDLVQDDPPFDALQITVDEVQSVLLELDISKGAGPDGIPPKNCTSAFARLLSLLFNRSLTTCIFLDSIDGNFPT
jgi:hypothetical protein